MDETTITAIIVILLIIGSMIAVTSAIIKSNKEAQKEREWKESTKCNVCGKCSMGKMFCEDCLNRLPVIKKELPYVKTKDFDTLNKFKQELIDNIIFAESKYEQEYNSIRLMAVSEILKDKYFVSDVEEKTADFLEEIFENDYTTKDIIINKYASSKKKIAYQQKFKSQQEQTQEVKNEYESFEVSLQKIKSILSPKDPEANLKEESKNKKSTEPQNEQSQFTKTDFRQRYEKPYRCNDGDYVRSKSEREIDDFLYANRIWHVYEPEYVCKNGKKYYPDFLLSDYDLYIEYFGKTDEEYIAKKKQKIEDLSAEPNIKFEYLEHTDDVNIAEKLAGILKKHNILK